VTSAQGGINCGNTCTAAFPTASSVTLTARPAGWRINLRWLGWRLHGRWALHGHHEQRSDGHCAVRPGAGSGHLDCEYTGARGWQGKRVFRSALAAAIYARRPSRETPWSPWRQRQMIFLSLTLI
jgi:hypothetical protein